MLSAYHVGRCAAIYVAREISFSDAFSLPCGAMCFYLCCSCCLFSSNSFYYRLLCSCTYTRMLQSIASKFRTSGIAQLFVKIYSSADGPSWALARALPLRLFYTRSQTSGGCQFFQKRDPHFSVFPGRRRHTVDLVCPWPTREKHVDTARTSL